MNELKFGLTVRLHVLMVRREIQWQIEKKEFSIERSEDWGFQIMIYIIVLMEKIRSTIFHFIQYILKMTLFVANLFTSGLKFENSKFARLENSVSRSRGVR